jgi:conjugative transposon TraN protein
MKRIFAASLMLPGAITLQLHARTPAPKAAAKTTTVRAEAITPASTPAPASFDSAGDYYKGFTKKIGYDRMIPPYGLEVTFEKTVHIIFPAGISYVDLGSTNIIAGKAPGSENVMRVKAAVRDFRTETNFSVITEDGAFYTYNVKYVNEPEKLSVEMKDFLHDGESVNRPNNAMPVYLTELGDESPRSVWLISRAIYGDDRRSVRHIGSKRFGVEFTLRSIHIHNDLLYLHTQIRNASNVSFDIDFIRMKIVDRQTAKRTAVQETVIYPRRVFNNVTSVRGNASERTVWVIDKITIPDGKRLVVEVFEKNGGRHQELVIENSDIVRARLTDDLNVK